MAGISDLLRLQALSGSIEDADDWAETYESALNNAKSSGDIEQIRQLKKLLMSQCLYMVSLYLREEARLKDIEQAGEVQ